jgi:hypothetical protein
MFGWLKRKGIETVQRQCVYNIKLNTKTLISIANRVYKEMEECGDELNEYDKAKVYKAQRSLLEDIILGCSNGLTLDEIENTIIRPILCESDVSSFASFMVNTVIKNAKITLKPEETNEITSVTTAFLQGNVSIVSFDGETTNFRLVENNAIVVVRNDTHLRLVEDISKIPSMPHFEVIAPMTAVRVVEGQIPECYLHEYTLDHYLALRRHYIGE